jgi:hypothetical protein
MGRDAVKRKLPTEDEGSPHMRVMGPRQVSVFQPIYSNALYGVMGTVVKVHDHTSVCWWDLWRATAKTRIGRWDLAMMTR